MDLGSGIRDPEKTYSGSRGQKGTGSRIWIRNTGVKILKFFEADPEFLRSWTRDGKIRIRDKNSGSRNTGHKSYILG
jgi:hypothetical protein